MDRRKFLGQSALYTFLFTEPWTTWLKAQRPPKRSVAPEPISELHFPRMIGESIVLDTESCRYEIGVNGQNRAFVNLATGKDYVELGQPFMLVGHGDRTWPSSKVELAGDVEIGRASCRERV